MSEVFLSIIVPVYQVEPYIARCLESLLHQQVPGGYEVILVDDGTKDASIDVAQKLLGQKDPEVRSRVRILRRENGGLSAARNTGIAASRGEYLQFVDSDDSLIEGSLESVCRIIQEQDLDLLMYDDVKIVAGHGQEQSRESESRKIPSDEAGETPISGPELMAQLVEANCYRANAWGYIFRRSLLEQSPGPLRFQEGILHEDELFTPQLLYAAKRSIHIQETIYEYYQRTGSITADNNMIPRIHGLAAAVAGLNDFFELHYAERNEREQIAYLKNLELLCRHILGEGSRISRRKASKNAGFHDDIRNTKRIFHERGFRADLPFRLYLAKNRVLNL